MRRGVLHISTPSRISKPVSGGSSCNQVIIRASTRAWANRGSPERTSNARLKLSSSNSMSRPPMEASRDPIPSGTIDRFGHPAGTGVAAHVKYR